MQEPLPLLIIPPPPQERVLPFHFLILTKEFHFLVT